MTAATHPALAGLMSAIIAEPEDDGLRLIYADALEENGKPEHGEFVRVQVELAQKRQTHADACPCLGCKALRRRERELFREDGPLRPLFDRYFSTPEGQGFWLGGSCFYAVFRRGFVAGVVCTIADWCGELCPLCQGEGWRGRAERARAYDLTGVQCSLCRGTGRVSAHGPALVRAAPLERVTPSDVAAGEYYQLNSRLPGDCWQGYLQRVSRNSGDPLGWADPDALSHALLAWARAQPVASSG